MDILIFIGGFILGAGLMFAVFAMTQKKTDATKDELMTRMQLEFQNLTNKIFKETSEEFSTKNKEKLEEFFAKFKEKIEDFEKRTEFNLKTEAEKLTQFDTNIKTFIEEGNKISHYTTNLANAMKSDIKKQGNWGEFILERVLEASGLRKGEEYELQKASIMGRADATILLPEGRKVFIDAKTSLASWEAYVNCEDETTKEMILKEFIDSTKAHITGLAERKYPEPENSPDYVLMFIPIESCYSLLFCDDNKLWDTAWKNKVMPVSPSTLLATLKIINQFYTVSRYNKNALEISRLSSKMLSKFADMYNDMLGVRKNVLSALTKLHGQDNILTNIRKLQELGATLDNKKVIPQELPDEIIEEIENTLSV